MSARKTRLADCNPHWVVYRGRESEVVDAVYFDCPEGHNDCHHVIPFTPALDGSVRVMEPNRGWHRTGDTFETLTLTPSVKRTPRHVSREAALKAGCLEGYLTETMFCALHIILTGGTFEFCGDSK